MNCFVTNLAGCVRFAKDRNGEGVGKEGEVGKIRERARCPFSSRDRYTLTLSRLRTSFTDYAIPS